TAIAKFVAETRGKSRPDMSLHGPEAGLASAPAATLSPPAAPRPPKSGCLHVGIDLRFPGLRHDHGVPGPVQEPHPSGQGPHPERVVPGAADAPRVRRLC